MPKVSEKYGTCELCAREKPLTFHHLIPRTTRTNKWFKKNFDKEAFAKGINLCRMCHVFIHKQFSEKELGRNYHSLDLLLESEVIQKYLLWAKRQK